MVTPAKFFKTSKQMILGCESAGPLDQWENFAAVVKQWWAFKIFNHDHKNIVIQSLQSRYTHAWKDINEFVDPMLNPLKKVANIKAQTYSRAPVRRTENEQLRALIKRSALVLNRKFLHGTKIVNAAGNVLLWPVITKTGATDTPADLALDCLVIPPHDVHLVPNYADGKYDIVARYVNYYLVSTFSGSARTSEVMDTAGKPLSVFQSIGDPVWVSLLDYQFGLPRCVGPVADLIYGTVSIGHREAFAEKVMYLRSFKQPQLDSEEKVNTDKLIAGPGQLWPTGLTTIDLVDKDTIFEDSITARAILLAGQHGVSKAAYTGEYADQQAWSAVSEELTHHYEEQLENWQLVEKLFWESVCGMAGIDISPAAEVVVKFTPPYAISKDPAAEFALHRERAKKGYETTIDRLRAEHPELETDEELHELYKENLERYAEETRMQREGNIPADETAVGRTPQENGALAKQFGDQGADGPSVDGKEPEVDEIKRRNNVD